jgi:hypothetical protein
MNNTFLDTLNELYLYSKSIINTKNITYTTLIILTNKLIQTVEKYKELNGTQKKMLILDTLTKLINENIDNILEKEELIKLINLIIPNIIDTVVSAINGEMKFTKDINQCCFLTLFKCFNKKNKQNEIFV